MMQPPQSVSIKLSIRNRAASLARSQATHPTPDMLDIRERRRGRGTARPARHLLPPADLALLVRQ